MYKVWCVLALLCFGQLPVLSSHNEEVDQSSVEKLCRELEEATIEAEALFAQFSSKAASCLKAFLDRSHSIGNDTIDKIDKGVLTYGPTSCRTRFAYRLQNIRHNAHVEAEYNADNHQKFFLAHMIVHRMHLNKTALFLKRAEGGLRTCGSSCRSPLVQNKLIRWTRTVRYELQRTTDDIQHSRLAYKDLFTHGSKRLGRIEKKAVRLIQNAVQELYNCSNRV